MFTRTTTKYINVYKNYNEIQQCLQELQRNTTMFIRTKTKYNNVYKNYIEIQQCLQELQRNTNLVTVSNGLSF